MRGVRGQHATPGEFRRSQNWIGAAGAFLKDATFVPPPPNALPDLLGSFERYLHSNDDLPLLIKLGLIHVHFETLHPFLDGNGRMGRLLITFCLCERDALKKPVLYLSHYLKRHRQRYYDHRQAIRDEGAWEPWLKFFLTGVGDVANEASETARKLVQTRELHRQKLVEKLGKGTANGLKLLESLYQRPIFTVSNASRYLNLSPQAANTLTDRFLELELVTEITGHKCNRVFRYQPYVALFSD
jgi:Fic family protein